MECESMPLSISGEKGDMNGKTGTSATGSPALSFVSEGGILTSTEFSLLVSLKYEIFI